MALSYRFLLRALFGILDEVYTVRHGYLVSGILEMVDKSQPLPTWWVAQGYEGREAV
jgi:hypothetical protein